MSYEDAMTLGSFIGGAIAFLFGYIVGRGGL